MTKAIRYGDDQYEVVVADEVADKVAEELGGYVVEEKSDAPAAEPGYVTPEPNDTHESDNSAPTEGDNSQQS